MQLWLSNQRDGGPVSAGGTETMLSFESALGVGAVVAGLGGPRSSVTNGPRDSGATQVTPSFVRASSKPGQGEACLVCPSGDLSSDGCQNNTVSRRVFNAHRSCSSDLKSVAILVAEGRKSVARVCERSRCSGDGAVRLKGGVVSVILVARQ